MDDLSDKIQQLLSSPDAMQKIQSMMSAFGGNDSTPNPPLPPPTSAPMPDMTTFLKLAPLISNMQQEDENAALLRALRPYMHKDRGKRIDEAIQILHLIKLLPLLKGFGKGD